MTRVGTSDAGIPCGLPGHVRVVAVDDYDVLFTSCAYPNGALHLDQKIEGKVTPERAAAVRRAYEAFARERGWE